MKLSNNIANPKGIKYELDKEVRTGDYWIDGSPIYCKVIYLKSLTSTIQKIATILNLDRVINVFGTAKKENNYQFMIGRVDLQQSLYSYFRILNEDLFIVDTEMQYTDIYVTVFYTKSGG